MPALGPMSWTLLVGALNGGAVALLLLRARENRLANRALAALLAVVVLRLVPYIIGYAGFYDRWPWLSFAPFDLPLAIGPLLWLHVEALTTGALPRRWGWHLAPAALHFATWSVLFAFVPLATRHAIVRDLVDPVVAPAITAGALAGLALYGVAALRRWRRYQRWLDDHLSNREEFRRGWLRALLVIMATQGAVWLGFALWQLVVGRLSYFDEFPFYVVQAVAAWALGLLAWREADVRYPVAADDAEPDAPRVHADATAPAADEAPAADAARAPDWAALGQRYRDALIANGWWRDPDLSLATLARHLATNTTYLSRALNRGLGQGFNECINRLRVDAVASELAAGSTRDLVQIAFDAGFNSKASFQRAFVHYRGQTPSAFREAEAARRAQGMNAAG